MSAPGRAESSVVGPANTSGGYNTPSEEGATFLPGFRRPGNRSWRSPRGKCTPTRSPANADRPKLGTAHAGRAPKMNPAGRLCGPIRLPLYGFTYS